MEGRDSGRHFGVLAAGLAAGALGSRLLPPLVSCPNDIVTNIRLSTSMLCDTISGVAIADNRTAGGVDAVGSVA